MSIGQGITLPGYNYVPPKPAPLSFRGVPLVMDEDLDPDSFIIVSAEMMAHRRKYMAENYPESIESPPREATALKPIKTTPKFFSIESS